MIRVLDLFSAAAGGWSLGMHRAGFTTIAACEFVDWRRALYSQNNPGVPVYDDVRTLTADRLVRDGVGLPDIVVGSPPCQDISSANTKGKGVDGEKSSLFFEASRIIGECGPRWFALENSDRVRTRGYDRIAASLEAHSYDCWPLVVGVGHAGGSHQRKRAWLLGRRRMGADASSSVWQQEGRRGVGRGRLGGSEAGRRTSDHMGSDANGSELRVECGLGAGWQEDGKEEVLAGLSLVFRGPVGTADLSSHIRAYDGLPGWMAERCREAYGDAVAPQIPEIIGKAILRTERALAEIHGRIAA